MGTEDNSSDEIVSESENKNGNTEYYFKRYYLAIDATAVASIMYGVSSSATAAIENSFLGDLVKADHLSEDMKHLVCDSKNVLWAKVHAMKYGREEDNLSVQKSSITGVFVDTSKKTAL